MQRRKVMTRRRFLGATAAAVGAPYVLTSAALGAPGTAAASERIVMGGIGMGGQGRGVLGAFLSFSDVQVVGVCDVNAKRAEPTRKWVEGYYAAPKRSGTHKGCVATRDFRELTDRDDIDAVVVGTPDHGHVMPVLAAARAGKSIYCEKPLTLTVAEGRAMSEAIHRYDVRFQHGTQQRSGGWFRHACELARNGRLGKLQRILVGCPGGRRSDYPKAGPVPEWFDYDLWLGPSPWAPFSMGRVSNGYWYHTSDYSAGFVSGWGVHHIDIAQWGAGMDHTGPVEIEGRGVYPDEGLCDTAVTWKVEYNYPNGVRVSFTDNGQNAQGVKFIGTDGWVYVRRGFIDAEPKSLLREKFGPSDVRLYRSGHHQRNLIDCMRTRRQTICPIETGHRSNSICLISDIAMRLQRKLKWDAATETFPGDDDANRMLCRAMRPPWRL